MDGYYIVSESTIKRMIKYKGECCASCIFDENDGFTDWGYELYADDIGYAANGQERFAHICCECKAVFKKWKKKDHNFRKRPGYI